MDLVKSYKLVQNGDGFDLTIYIDSGLYNVEFARELGSPDENNAELKQNLIQNINDKFPNLKINVVKVMAGAMLLASFAMGIPTTAYAADSTQQTQSAYNYNVKVALNGNLLSFQHRAMIYNNITYVPLSEFGKSIGANVWWNNTSNTVGINQYGKMIAFVRGASLARVNGVQVSMPHSIVIGDTTYAPLRFIAENLGYKVALNSSTHTVNITSQTKYTVQAGDSLWKISQKFGVSIDSIKRANNLTNDNILAGQVLIIPKASATPAPAPTPAPSSSTRWPEVTYVVQPGDTGESISKKFGVPVSDILKYNYMDDDDWFYDGDKIAISGYAPRQYTVTPGQASVPARKGSPVEWVYEGQYLVKRGDIFTVVDVATGKQFKARMIGGFNHVDMEPLTTADTNVMKSLFGTWTWTPRAVVIYINGMNLAASLSGMPHDVDTIDNGVNGHFDLYMKNSTSHSSTTSSAYIAQHQDMVRKAAGQ